MDKGQAFSMFYTFKNRQNKHCISIIVRKWITTCQEMLPNYLAVNNYPHCCRLLRPSTKCTPLQSPQSAQKEVSPVSNRPLWHHQHPHICSDIQLRTSPKLEDLLVSPLPSLVPCFQKVMPTLTLTPLTAHNTKMSEIHICCCQLDTIFILQDTVSLPPPLFLNFFFKFFTMLGLCFVWALLYLQRAGTTLRHSAQASHYSGFSCCKAQVLGSQTSVVAACGLGRPC